VDVNRLLLTSLFSREYALQGIVMIESFLRYHPKANVIVFSLDSKTKQILEDFFENQIEVVNLSESATFLPLFTAFRGNRSLAETIFTLKVYWVNYVLATLEPETCLVYADADMYFMDSMGDFNSTDWSILISPHLFPKHREHLNDGGLFNAGLIGIKSGDESRRIISWWQNQVLEYCGTSKARGLYADQRYLDTFPSLGEGVRVFRQLGTNTGMWQVSRSRILHRRKNYYSIGGDSMNSFHFHGLRISRFFIRRGMMRYGLPIGSILAASHLYRTYSRELVRVVESLPELDLKIYVHQMSGKTEFIKGVRNPLKLLDLEILPFGFRKW